MNFNKIIISSIILALLTACSTAPKVSNSKFLSDYQKLKSYKEKPHYRQQNYIDNTMITGAKTLDIGRTNYSGLILPEGIAANQIELVANAVDRELCKGLSAYFEIVDEGQPADLQARSSLTGIRSTGKGMAAVSAVIGNVSPVWLRPTKGMGALAAEAEILDKSKQQGAAIVWARGARSIGEGESISSIGDAYQLAEVFANDFIKLIVADRKKTKDASALKKANHEKCLARYGKNKALGTAASWLLPMSPESKDDGRPKNQTLPNALPEMGTEEKTDQQPIEPTEEPIKKEE